MGVVERKQREKEKRAAEILEAAKNIFFTKGYKNTTMDDIARESELAKGTLYLYFSNKEELLHAIMYESFKTLKGMIEKAVRRGGKGIEKIRRIGKVVIKYYMNYSSYFEILRNFDYNLSVSSETDSMAFQCSRLIDEMIDIFISVLKEGVNDGTIRRGIEPEKTAILYANIITSFLQRMSVMGQIINQRNAFKPQELIEHFLDFMIHALQ
ncbi:MAG: TetR/AcrR family transcriptional regulator [Spirochaetota bacterium]